MADFTPNVMRRIRDWVAESYDDHPDEYKAWLLLMIVPLAVLLTTIAGFAALDTFATPEFRRARKLQPAFQPTLEHYLKAAKVVAFNLLFVSIIFMYIICVYIMPLRGAARYSDDWSVFQLLRDLPVILICEEIGFYLSHRLFHLPILYKHIHKQHHDFTAPFALAANYAHPIEHIVANLSPLLAGAVIMGSHPFTITLWISGALINTSVSHSGWNLPMFFSPSFHDWHHEKFNENFGVLEVLDHWFKTDTRYRKAMASGSLTLPRQKHLD